MADTPKDWNSSEAIICFAAWLTMREEAAVTCCDDAAGMAELVEAFRVANDLPEARDEYASWSKP